MRHGDCAFSYGTDRTNAKIEMTTQRDEFHAPRAQRTDGALDRADDLNNRSDFLPLPDRPPGTHPAGPHDTGRPSNLSALNLNLQNKRPQLKFYQASMDCCVSGHGHVT